jgi:hypothetical protein
LAVESVKHAAIDRKFATKMMFSKLLLAAETAIEAVLAVSSVMVGRVSPSPSPMMRTPALVQDSPWCVRNALGMARQDDDGVALARGAERIGRLDGGDGGVGEVPSDAATLLST